MNNQRNSGAPVSSFDQDFGGQHFEPVEETVVIDGDIAARLVDRRRPGDSELAQVHRLLVVDPTGEEWEYAIDGELMLGRAEDNHIALPDRAVSRHHLAVNTDGQLYWFQDLNSGNGTQVNGEFVKEGWLTGGEEIVIGNSHIYFLVPEIDAPPELAQAEAEFVVPAPMPDVAPGMEGAPVEGLPPTELPPAPAEEKSGGAGRFLALLFLLLVLGGVGVAGWWIYTQIKSKPSKISQNTPKQPRPDQEALQLFEQGKLEMQKGNLNKADALLRKAASIIPGSDPMRGTILQYYNLVSKERTARHHFEQAERLYNKDQVAKALAMLQRVPTSSKIHKQAETFRERIYKKELYQRMKMLQLQRSSNKILDARKTLQEILSIAPQYQPALQIQRELFSKDPGASRAVPRPVKRNPYGNSDKLPKQLQDGKALFCAGKYAMAVTYFLTQQSGASTAGLRSRATLFRQRVENFERKLSSGINAYRRRKYSRTLSRLKAARKIDDKYFGGCRKSSYKRPLSRAYLKRSRRSYRRRRYRRAKRYIKKARKLSPKSRAVSKASASIRKKARRMINDATVLIGVDDNVARKSLRKAMGMLPSSDPLYNKAKRLLNRVR